MNSKKLRAAIIGYGGMGHFHASCYPEQENIELVAICDTDKSKFAQTSTSINIGDSGKSDLKNVVFCSSYSELVKKVKFDVLDICLPCHLHAKYAIQAMKDGFHVLCEKPMARTATQAEKMIQASKETGKRLMIAQCLRFNPAFIRLKEMYHSQEFGKLLRLDMRRNSAMPPNAWYHDPKKSGGALLDLHLHDTDLVNYIFGMPDAVQTFGIVRDTGGIDDLLTNYIFENGPVINAESSWCRASWFSSHIAIFEKATVEFSKPEIKIHRTGKESEIIPMTGPNNYFREIACFAKNVIEDAPFDICSVESTLNSIKIAMAEERSARRNGKRISLKKS